MMPPSSLDALPYGEIWVVDTEFRGTDAAGELPIVHCVVAVELRSGRTHRVWNDEFDNGPPFDLTNDDSLMVAYMASAECGSFRVIGWPQPTHVLDLYVEFCRMINGRGGKKSLLACAMAHHIPAMDAAEKVEMRDLAIKGGPFTDAQREALLDYCEADVRLLERLLPRMLPNMLDHHQRPRVVNLMHALLRGRYMKAVSHVEQRGAPLDIETLYRLRENWTAVQSALVAEVDRDYGVYEGTTFSLAKFDAYLRTNNIPWPRTATGRLRTDDKTFQNAVKDYPVLRNLYELHATMSVMRSNKLVAGSDGHNRISLRPFSSKTGRNQPSNAEAIFGAATWLRGLIKPPRGYALAYIDWAAQEIANAAALSGDEAMKADYLIDPYLSFAKRAGTAPPDATKASHKAERDQMKPVLLGINYGRSAQSLSDAMAIRKTQAEDLLWNHRVNYPDFWLWIQGAVAHAMYTGWLWTTLGWDCDFHGTPFDMNPRSAQNYLLQGNGAEQMRLAVCECVESGIDVVAVVHDALLIMAPIDRIEEDLQRATEIMERASNVVLGGFTVRADGDPKNIIRYPDRYMDPRGRDMWEKVLKILASVEATQQVTAIAEAPHD